jgi:acetolactate synthase-1/2/3 large subunit
VATSLSHARYDEVVRALGGFGAWVTQAAELGPALDEAFSSGRPACVNVKLGASDFRKGAISV